MASEEVNRIRAKRKQVELDIKKLELLAKQKELEKTTRKRGAITIERATILVAIIGFIASFLGNFLQGYFGQQQEKHEFQSSLITKAVETGNSKQSKNNLKFLLDAGLIEDADNKIRNMVTDTSYNINFVSGYNLSDTLQKTDLEYLISQICNTIGITQNFILIPQNNINNIFAAEQEGKKYIVYDPKFVQSIRAKTSTTWSTIFLFAHECSHHLLGHILLKQIDSDKIKQYELDADETAGFILAKMGAPLPESLAALRLAENAEQATLTHPDKSSRLSAIEKGWNNAKRQF